MQIKEFEIGSKVLEDGIGILYHADNIETADRVYLRTLGEMHTNDPELVALFHECAEVCCSLENKHQLQTLGHGQENGWHYIVLEYANMSPLEKALSKHHFVSLNETLLFIEKLATNLRTYHLEGLAHGHLNPRNIFVNRDLTQIKIADVGFEPLVRLLYQKKPQLLSASVPYYAPEVKTVATPIDRTSDIMSIGVLFYQLLLNELPGTTLPLGNGDSESLNIIIPPSLRRLEIPQCLDALILTALEVEPQKRCPNLSQFINKLFEARTQLLEAVGTLTAAAHEQNQEDTQSRENGSEPPLRISFSDELQELDQVSPQEPSRSSLPFYPISTQTDSHEANKNSTESAKANAEEFSAPPPDDIKTEEAIQGHFDNGSNGTEKTTKKVDSGEEPNGHCDSEETIEFPANRNGIHASKSDHEPADLPNGYKDSKSARPTDRYENGHKNDDDLLDDLIREGGTNGKASTKSRTNVTLEPSNYKVEKSRSQLIEIFEQDDLDFGQARGDLKYSEPPKLEDIISEVEDADRNNGLLTETSEFSTTDTINIYRPKFKYSSAWGKIKIVALALVPIAILVALATSFVDFGSKRGPVEPNNSIASNTQPASDPTLGSSEQEPATAPVQSEEAKASVVEPRSSAAKTVKTPAKAQSQTSSKQTPLTKPVRRQPVNKPAKSNLPSAPATAPKTTARNEGQEKPAALATFSPASNAVLLKIRVQHANQPQSAEVYLDGKHVGRTDGNGLLTVSNLKIEVSYLIRVEGDGFQMWAKEINLGQKGTNHLHVSLVPLDGATQIQNNTPVNPAAKGKVTVILANPQTAQYAFIYLNGKLWKDSIAPAELHLPAGEYVLELKRDGFRSDPPSQTFQLKGGDDQNLRFYLNPE